MLLTVALNYVAIEGVEGVECLLTVALNYVAIEGVEGVECAIIIAIIDERTFKDVTRRPVVVCWLQFIIVY